MAQEALFQEQPKRPFVDWFNLYGVQKAMMPEGWRWFSSEVLNYQAPRSAQSYVLTGAVVPNYTKGKRVGQPNFKGRDKAHDRSFSVSVPALEAFEIEWEQAEGKCHKCVGTGEEWAGWSRETGVKYVTCTRCSGSGQPVSSLSLAGVK